VSTVAAGVLLTAVDGDGSPVALRIRGADISFTLQEEAAGKRVRGPVGEAPIEQVLAGYGANTVRLRLWVAPPPGTSDLVAALRLARRASDAGLQIILVLQYSDTWADHSIQATPAAWSGLDLDDVAEKVRSYSRDVVAAFAGQGTPLAVVQIGNEIDHGLLWPVGELATVGWDAVARLVAAGAEGAREGGRLHPPEIMVHRSAGEDTESVVRFFAELEARGVRPDLVGLSYYPWWNGSLERLQDTLNAVAERFDVDVLLAETARPWTLADGDAEPNAVTTVAQLPDGDVHPPTPEGQATWAEALRQVMLRVPHGHGAGFLFWEPGWLPGVDATPGVGSSYDNTTLFSWDGGPLPALAGRSAATRSIGRPTPDDKGHDRPLEQRSRPPGTVREQRSRISDLVRRVWRTEVF
jgi:arabinogalactan endo-1,4-beta-galactosidase